MCRKVDSNHLGEGEMTVKEFFYFVQRCLSIDFIDKTN